MMNNTKIWKFINVINSNMKHSNLYLITFFSALLVNLIIFRAN